jgi:hypothetical protein
MEGNAMIETKNLPEVLRLALKSLGYRKRKASLRIAQTAEIYGTNWYAGSRNEYFSFDHDGRPLSQHWQGGSWVRPKPTTLELNGRFVIQAGTFRGKQGLAFIYISRELAKELGICSN